MKSLALTGTLREANGKKNAKAIRDNDQVLCVLYGGENLINFHAPVLAFRDLVYTHEVFTVDLSIDGKKYNAILQDIQFHPVSDKILHIDFLELSGSKEVVVNIPVKITGNSIGVRQGGKMVTKVRKLKVRALPNNLPDNVEVNVDTLDIGKSIRIGDIKLNNVEILDAPSNVITTVKLTRQAMAAAAAESKGKK